MQSSSSSHNKKSVRPLPQNDDTVRRAVTANASAAQPGVTGPSRGPYATSGVHGKSGDDSQATPRSGTGLTPLKIPSYTSPTVNTHRPFSPSAIASRSGKTIKAFFRNRHADVDSQGTLGSRVDVNANLGSSTSVVGLPSISVRVSPDLGSPSQIASRNSATVHQRISLKTSESRVQFPKVHGDDSSMQKAVEHEHSKRKPRLSLSLFRSASKSKAIAKLSSAQAVDSSRNARIAPEIIRKPRPLSALSPQHLSASSHDPRQKTKKNGPGHETAALKTSKLSPSRPASIPVKAVRSSADDMDPKPPDRLLAEEPATLELSPHSPIPTAVVPDLDREAHYLLRMACTYLTKTILPEVKAAQTSRGATQPSTASTQESRTASEKADALRRHVYDKIKLLERMERAWGIDWMLRGKDGFTISDARKEKERASFRQCVEDGVVMCL